MTAFLLLAALAAAAQTQPGPTIVLVVGAPGRPRFEAPLCQWAERWEKAAARAGAKLLQVGRDPAGDTSDHDQLAALLQAEPRGQDHAPLWLVFLGHGTFDGRKARFNLRGPDLTAAELAQWLDPFARPVAVINCASSSAPFINRLSRPGRIVVTATKSGYQWNATRFGDYLSAAIADPAADLDKDEQTSLLEAFLIASRQTRESYDAQGRLATETALIDDNGDGRGTPASSFHGARVPSRNGTTPDGARAHQLHLILNPRQQRLSPPQRRRCLQLEQAVAQLRDSKPASTDEDAYYARLEPLLVELARIDQGTDRTVAGPQDDRRALDRPENDPAAAVPLENDQTEDETSGTASPGTEPAETAPAETKQSQSSLPGSTT